LNAILILIGLAAAVFIGPWCWWGLANFLLSVASLLGFDRRSSRTVWVSSFIALWITVFVFLLFTGTWHVIGSFVLAVILSVLGNHWGRSPTSTNASLVDSTNATSIDQSGDATSIEQATGAPSDTPPNNHTASPSTRAVNHRPLILRDPSTCPHCLEPGIPLWWRGTAAASVASNVRCSRCKTVFRLDVAQGRNLLPWVRIGVMFLVFALVVSNTFEALEFMSLVLGVLVAVAAHFALDRVIGAANVGTLRPLKNSFIDGGQPRRPWSDRSTPVDVVAGFNYLDDRWSIVLPEQFKFRNDDVRVVLTRPGLKLTIEVVALGIGESPAERYAELKRTIPADATHVCEAEADGIRMLRYCDKRSVSAKHGDIHGFTMGKSAYVSLNGEFMEESDLETAERVLRSCAQRDHERGPP
jgi:hypothetical protein